MKQLVSWSWWKARPRLWFAYVILALTGILGFVFFRILNWTRVEGKEKFKAARRKHGDRRNVIIVSNHVTMFDSFIIGIIAYFAELLFWPSIAPYHLAAKENYFKYWFFRLILGCLNTLPVAPGRVDAKVMQQVITLLPRPTSTSSWVAVAHSSRLDQTLSILSAVAWVTSWQMHLTRSQLLSRCILAG